MEFVRHYLLALQFFTRIPVTGPLAQWVGFSPRMLRASAAHFPGVGLLVGMAACLVFALVSLALPSSPYAAAVAAAGSTLATVLLTGGFHEDGLADTADGLGGSADRERALQIMKDSRLGAFGAMALVLVLLAKVLLLALLGALSPAAVLTALLAGHALSRLAALLVVHTLPHVGDAAHSKSKPLADRIDPPALAIAAAWCVVPLALLLAAAGIASLIAALLLGTLALWALRRWFELRLQGFTGDCLGATQQVCELACYLGVAIGLRGT